MTMLQIEEQNRNFGGGNRRYSRSLCGLYGRELRQGEAFRSTYTLFRLLTLMNESYQ